MSSSLASPFITILVAGVLANGIWRMAGVMLSSGLSDQSPLFLWALAMSRALIAGLIARIIIFPPGALAAVGLPVRVGALFLGVAVFYAASRNVGAGILCGTAALILMHLAMA